MCDSVMAGLDKMTLAEVEDLAAKLKAEIKRDPQRIDHDSQTNSAVRLILSVPSFCLCTYEQI